MTDRIEKLESENARLRESEANLRGFVKQLRCRMTELWGDLIDTREALKKAQRQPEVMR